MPSHKKPISVYQLVFLSYDFRIIIELSNLLSLLAWRPCFLLFISIAQVWPYFKNCMFDINTQVTTWVSWLMQVQDSWTTPTSFGWKYVKVATQSVGGRYISQNSDRSVWAPGLNPGWLNVKRSKAATISTKLALKKEEEENITQQFIFQTSIITCLVLPDKQFKIEQIYNFQGYQTEGTATHHAQED